MSAILRTIAPPDASPGPAPFGYDAGTDVPTLAGDMPLLDEFVNEHERKQPLAGVTALLIQHQLGNQAPQAEALRRLGLEPKRTFWLDIPYTSSARFRVAVADRLQIPDSHFWVNRYRVLEPYDTYQLRRTQEVVRHLLRMRPKRLIVLDDGAYFLAAASSFRRQFGSVAVVEQTTRGMIKLQENEALGCYAAGIPVIDVARSEAKRRLESPWIGIAVVAALDFHLSRIARRSPRFAVRRDAPCLVLGYGAVGRAVAHHLQSRAIVFVSDPNRLRLREAEAAGFRTWDRRRGARCGFKLVVGCTGRQSFHVGDFVHLDRHAVLASASSGAVELSRRDFIDLAAASQIDDIRIETRWLHEDDLHQPLHIQLADRQVIFLNAGFPINFDGRLNCIPAKYMQPTAMLMVEGAMQAASTLRTGIIRIRPSFAKRLTDAFFGSLSMDERALVERAGN